jgi:hypothetical protein
MEACGVIRIAAIAGAILLGLLALSNWQRVRAEKALRKAETALELSQAQVKAEQAARAQDELIAKELAAIRDQSAASFRQFDETLKTSKVTREVRYVTQTGETVTCTNRDASTYRSLFNQAVSGSANP